MVLKEQTFVMVKPDGVAKGVTEEVVKRLEKAGLKVVSARRLRLNRRLAEELYSVHKGKDFFEALVVHVLSGEVVVMKVDGEGAISKVRALIGPTNPAAAPHGTIRGDFGRDIINTIIRKNIVHASDSPESAKRELEIFFKH
ncbi:MAG: nucleoside-diphosphate kinase [Candidatus Hadarchaeota archaeon]